MDKRPEIIIHRRAQQSLDKLTQNTQQSPAVADDISVAAMLSQLHGVAGTLLRELKIDDQPIAKRISMAKDMAKLIPLLATAERKVRKGWKNKDVEDMTDLELKQARKAIQAAQKR